ncbi:MAG TPA: histidine kinase dimerization/phospho-acceptor domain-containing protein [Phycisphaerae bacterium]|jgi:signal transduction histidine kinase
MMLLLAAGAVTALLSGFILLAAAFVGGITIGGSTVIVLISRNCAALDQSLQKLSKSHTFQNAAGLEERRRHQIAIQSLIDSLPHAVAFVTPDGYIEMANSRCAWFDMEPGKSVQDSPHAWLKTLVGQAINTRQLATLKADSDGHSEKPVQFFDEGRELFFLPQATPLIDPAGSSVLKILIVLQDVSVTHKAEEAKSSLLSSFSHELKTPMTSIQMSIYLLLDDAADRLTPRQLELLTAARDDSDRLHRVLEKALTEARAKW